MDPSQCCVLIAEDDSALLYALSRTISRAGYRVLEAVNGDEAVQRETEYEGVIHVLITDIRMPRMDGHELVRKMKKRRPEIKVIVVSAYSESSFPPEAKHYDVVFRKPVMPSVVSQKLAALLADSALEAGAS